MVVCTQLMSDGAGLLRLHPITSVGMIKEISEQHERVGGSREAVTTVCWRRVEEIKRESTQKNYRELNDFLGDPDSSWDLVVGKERSGQDVSADVSGTSPFLRWFLVVCRCML